MKEDPERIVKKTSRDRAEVLLDEQALERERVGILGHYVWGHQVNLYNNEVSRLGPDHELTKEINIPMRDQSLRDAIDHVRLLARNERGAALSQITAEILQNPELKNKVAKFAPHFQNVEEDTRLVGTARLLGAVYKDQRMTLAAGAMRRDAAINFWKTAQFSDELWLELIGHHTAEFNKAAKFFYENVARPSVEESYMLIGQGLRGGIIPLSRNRVDKTFQTNKVILADALYQTMEQIGGFYSSDEKKIGISSALLQWDTYDKDVVSEVSAHEWVHALAGITAIEYFYRELLSQEELDDIGYTEEDLRENPELKVEDSNPKAIITRGGVRFAEKDLRMPSRFRWLNEAATEVIVDELKPDRKHKTYRDFRAMLDHILYKGNEQINFELLRNAYFEDYEPNVPAAQRIPYWKGFWSAVGNAHGPKFLSNFDRCAAKNGAKRALEMAEEGKIERR